MNRKYPVRVILAPIVIAIAIVSGILIGKYYKTGQQSNSTFYIYPRTDKLTNILNYIEREYVDKLDKDKLVEDAIPKILS